MPNGQDAAGRKLQVSITPNDTLIRVISARPMSRRERASYEEDA